MSRTQYYTATSVDGFIADCGNSLGWLFQVESTPDRFPAFFADVGAFAMGATTYEWVLEHEQVLDQPQKWAAWYGDTPSWVFTHRSLPPVPGANITFVSGDVRPVHEAMVQAADGRNVWLVGGGELVGTFADHGLVGDLLRFRPGLGDGARCRPRPPTPTPVQPAGRSIP